MQKYMATILIVDDDFYIRESLREILTDAGYRVQEAADGKTALDLLTQQQIDLMLLDLDLPRVPGMEVLRKTAAEFPEVSVVIISGKGTVQLVVEAIKLGAHDFLEKPLERERTLTTVKNAVEKLLLLRQCNRLLDEAKARYQMVGTSPAMQRIYHLIDKAATSHSKVLITGESGTGKELIARAIHYNSPQAAMPFVAVNCSAIPETLIESELFGHEKGAYTGAYSAHRGKFEQANGGTLLLDEIGDTSPMMQVKLLRALEDGVITRVGSERPIPVDLQLITATHTDLELEIQQGKFREDLYYRLNVITIEVPPLRSHSEDIPLLIDHFLNQFSHDKHLELRKLDRGSRKLLVGYDWPGNVRELRNVIERLVVLSEDTTITVAETTEALRKKLQAIPKNPTSLNLHEERERFERNHIRAVLDLYDWKILETAAVLGIERSHLWKKMKQYGIERGE